MARRSRGPGFRASSRVLGLVLIAISMWLVACRPDETIELRAWTLRAHDGAETAVTLPAHVDAQVTRGSTYTLRSEVTVPEAWRERPLTLAIPWLEGKTTLAVFGAEAAPLEESVVAGHPSLGAQSFRVDRVHTQAGTLTATPSSWPCARSMGPWWARGRRHLCRVEVEEAFTWMAHTAPDEGSKCRI